MIYTGKYKRMRVYRNTSGKTPAQIKSETGCDVILNGVLFEGKNLLCLDQKVDGKLLRDQPGDYPGIAWSDGKFPVATTLPNAGGYDNFISSCEADPTNRRGRTALALNTKKQTFTVLCTSDSSGAMTWAAARDTIAQYGDIYIVLDGGGSSCCITPTGATTTSKSRATQNQTYILLWEYGVPVKHKVCLDPGHGHAELNCSPDKRYFEYQFSFDLASRVKALLDQTECFDVLLTKDDAESTPSLTARAAKANAWGAELYISEHSNAVATKDRDGDGVQDWENGTHGLTAWIYAAGGKREEFAKLYLAQCKEQGMELFGNQLYTANFSVLAKTNMPACLIEHYFHTCNNDVDKLLSNAERDKLAYVQACAICEYFNLSENLIPLTKEEEEVEKAVQHDIRYRIEFTDEADAKAIAEVLKAQGYGTAVIKEDK